MRVILAKTGSQRYSDAGSDLSVFGGDELWDDDQWLMYIRFKFAVFY